MLIDSPMPFVEALAQLERKELFPKNLSSAVLRRLDKEIRERSFFSAKTMYEDLLDGYKTKIQTILNPVTVQSEEGNRTEGLSYAQARGEIKELLRGIGYSPEEAKEGTIEDLSSNSRINLVLRTNAESAMNFGRFAKGQDKTLLYEYPAQELIREEDRDVPRGQRMVKGELEHDEGQDWESRFEAAGNASGESEGWGIFEGRMIALKNHPIWEALADGEGGYDDSIPGNIWGPFAFNSGMGLEDVDRDEAIELGLMEEDDEIEPAELSFKVKE